LPNAAVSPGVAEAAADDDAALATLLEVAVVAAATAVLAGADDVAAVLTEADDVAAVLNEAAVVVALLADVATAEAAFVVGAAALDEVTWPATLAAPPQAASRVLPATAPKLSAPARSRPRRVMMVDMPDVPFLLDRLQQTHRRRL
jgi:hypothetical protein